jgi:ubiquitin carboxyl-terminal hydrolase 14
VTEENEIALNCPITKDVGFMASGIRVGLTGTLTKQSPSLGREAVYAIKKQIERLPGCVLHSHSLLSFSEHP